GGWGGVVGTGGDGAVQPTVVEPVDVGHGGELDVVDATPGSLAVDEPLSTPAGRYASVSVVIAAGSLCRAPWGHRPGSCFPLGVRCDGLRRSAFRLPVLRWVGRF